MAELSRTSAIEPGAETLDVAIVAPDTGLLPGKTSWLGNAPDDPNPLAIRVGLLANLLLSYGPAVPFHSSILIVSWSTLPPYSRRTRVPNMPSGDPDIRCSQLHIER